MSLIAFLWAMFVQMKGSELSGNAWTDKTLDYTLQNLHSIQGFFGWITLACVILIVLFVGFTILTGKGAGAAMSALGCFGWVGAGSVIVWLIGWLHIFAVGYLAANFTASAGALNPGFYILAFLMIITCWS